MSGPLFLSRIRLRRDGSAAALAALLVPAGGAAPRSAAGHRLIWSLFADAADRRRDFLWREQAPGQFLTLSSRVPVDRHELFEVEPKPFEPALTEGDRLRFSLRANPVVAVSAAPGRRGQRHDVVMHALKLLAGADARAAARLGAVQSAGAAWLTRQGERHGFVPEGDVAVDGYERLRIPRDGAADAVFGVADIEGVLRVTDAARFLAQLARGFGRARAFGHGLMLIRRAE
jgi:CRISPR system Cascade subunit CasE